MVGIITALGGVDIRAEPYLERIGGCSIGLCGRLYGSMSGVVEMTGGYVMVKRGWFWAVLLSAAALTLGGCCCVEPQPIDSGWDEPVADNDDDRPDEPDDDDEPEKPAEDPDGDDEEGGVDEHTLSKRGNQKISSFSRSKRIIMEIFEGRQNTFYCGCRYTKDKEVYLNSCGYKVRKNGKRAKRLEIEHVVPASDFGGGLPSWLEGHPECLSSKKKPYKGRRCATKISKLFAYMEADLYNLQPAIGEVNGDRSNYPPAILEGEEREYGKCDVEIEDEKFEPRPKIRGNIARSYMYMDWAYPGLRIIHSGNRKLIEGWHKADPVDDAEREWAKKVQEAQGNKNPFIK